jgi:hypothetical protein
MSDVTVVPKDPGSAVVEVVSSPENSLKFFSSEISASMLPSN